MNKKILIVTGASGGHIFPALGLLGRLRDKHKNIDALLVLPRGIKNQFTCNDYRVSYVSASAIKIKFDLRNLTAIFNFLKSFFEGIFILAEFRPTVVVGFGSIISIPLVFAAWLFRIKTLIHEQNVFPGRANRFMAVFVDKVAVSFPQTKDYLRAGQGKIVFTGNPIRQELKRCPKNESLDFFGLSQDKLTILVMGGSQGSHRINGAFLEAIARINNQDRLQVIHLTGQMDYDQVRASYEGLKIQVRLFSFLEKMQFAYSASDIVISRAGATTIAELAYFALPAILIPYPFAYQHQLLNAQALGSYGSAVVLEEKALGNDGLRQAIAGLLDNPAKIHFMRDAYRNISWSRADNLLAEEVFSLA